MDQQEVSILQRKLSQNTKSRIGGLHFVEKTFTGGSQTAKFVKVSPSKVSRCTV